MAKDGTNRGGARVGAGAKKKPLADKISDGNPGGRKLTVMEFKDTADLKGLEMPEPNKMLEAIQKDGKTLVASEIYKSTWTWLNERGCAVLVSPQLLERYAMDGETWMNANKAIELGFVDAILEDSKRGHTEDVVFAFSRRAVTNSLMNKLISKSAPKPEQKKQDAPTGVSVEAAMQKLQARKYI